MPQKSIKSKTRTKWCITVLFLCMGEYIELISFAFMTPTIGTLFFAQQSQWHQQLYSISLFSLAYLVRPVGGYFIGYFSDIYGRKQGLIMISIIGAVASLCIGLLPTHSITGLLLLIFLRLVQGVTLSNESILVAIWLYESTTSHRIWISYLIAVLAFATLFALGIISGLTHYLPSQDFLDWGWRLPFMLSGAVIALSFWIRKNMPETATNTKQKNTQSVWAYYILSTILSTFVLQYMYLPRYLPNISNQHLGFGWLISIITAVIIARFVPSIKTAGYLLLCVSLICLTFQDQPWIFTGLYQIGLTIFVTSGYCWIVETLPREKLGRLFGLYSQLGTSTSALSLPIIIGILSKFMP